VPLIKTGDGFDVTAPGGGWMVFHGDCEEGRCLFGAMLWVEGEVLLCRDVVSVFWGVRLTVRARGKWKTHQVVLRIYD
jgi:hypothetical protein